VFDPKRCCGMGKPDEKRKWQCLKISH